MPNDSVPANARPGIEGGILHVLNDAWFMQPVSRAFETVAPGTNTFVAFGFDGSELSVPATASVVGLTRDASGRRDLDRLIADSGITIFHNVSEQTMAALATAPQSVFRVWSGWGGDYYGSTYDSYAGQLAPATRKVVRSTVRPTYWAGRALRALRVGPILNAAARASDVFSAPVPEDFPVFRRRFPRFSGVYSQLNYATVEDSIATDSRPVLGRDILLGNSASPTNNHFDVLALLATLDLDGRKVVAPLSYGDSAYASSVARAGRELLGESFVPITDFLPLEQYNELLSGCGIVMLGHYRQEGVGNVLRALWQGARLVLDRRNPIAEHLTARGVEVDLIDGIRANGIPESRVFPAQTEARRVYLDENWSRAAAVRNVERLVALAMGN